MLQVSMTYCMSHTRFSDLQLNSFVLRKQEPELLRRESVLEVSLS